MGDLDYYIPWWSRLAKDQQRALVNMAFQMGVKGLLKFKKMLRALESGDMESTAMEARDSLWYNQTPNRAERVIKMLTNTGENK